MNNKYRKELKPSANPQGENLEWRQANEWPWSSAAFGQAAAPPQLAHSLEDHSSLGHHHLDELLVVDLSVTINICLPDHFINFLIRELFSEVGHHMPQLRSADEPVAVPVKYLESLDELFLSVCVLHLSCHQRQELWEVNCAVPICIHLIDHILQLSLRWILPQGAHHRAQLFCRD